MSEQIIIREGKLEPAQEKTYVHVPFDVPADAARIQVEYTYSDKIGSDPALAGGNTIDLGVFDARGIDFLTAGFRGWSGSERSSFFISETEATPGYLAGPLTPGRWHVLLGLYKVARQGCSYRVKIEITTRAIAELKTPATHPEPISRGGDLPASTPRAPFAPWLRGELHCHSWHSDGDRRPAEVVTLARERGLDFLAISDHNTIAGQRELVTLQDPGLILIRGVEATTFKGHFGIWGIPDWIDFRVQSPEQMRAALQFAQAHGALTSCNHPKPLGPPWDYSAVTDFECVEVWNGPWTLLNQMALDYWTGLLATGRRIPAVGGSDWHRQHQLEENPPRAPGTPTVWVYTPGPPGASAILEAIRRGHVVLSSEPNGAFIDLRAGDAMVGDAVIPPSNGEPGIRVRCQRAVGSILRLIDQKDVLFEQAVSQADETIATGLVTRASLYIRAELRSPQDDLVAMTNPIYFGENH